MSDESDRIKSVRALLRDAEVAYRKVIKGDRPSGQAVAALLKRREDLSRDLHDLLDAALFASQDETPPTEEEMIAQAVADLASLPDPLLDEVLAGLVTRGRGAAVRRNAPPAPLRVVGDE